MEDWRPVGCHPSILFLFEDDLCNSDKIIGSIISVKVVLIQNKHHSRCKGDAAGSEITHRSGKIESKPTGLVYMREVHPNWRRPKHSVRSKDHGVRTVFPLP